MNDAAQTICLSMIVKNESHVICRCLESLLPLLDTWAIVDTGSTDGTQQVIREYLQNIPGEFFERPWVDFAHNRTEAIALAHGRADYLLIIDADEYLELNPGFRLPQLTADAYEFEMRSGSLSYYKTQLVRDALPWIFRGVLHEYIFCESVATNARMPGVITRRIQDGARSRDPMTYRRDALLLEEALLQEPGNERHMFYLAQSYVDAREPDLAIDRYRKRVAMGGWIEEVWYSLYQIAKLMELKGMDWPLVLAAYLAAFSYRADRAEPLFRIGFHYQTQKEFALSYLFLSKGMEVPYPAADILFVDRFVYEVLLPLEFSVSCFYVGRHGQAIAASNRLLQNPELTPGMIEQVIQNRQYSLEALYPKRSANGAGERRLSRVVVCVFFDETSSFLARCIGSLRQQEGDFQAVLIDNGSGPSDVADFPLDDVRFQVRRSESRLTWAECLNLAAEGAAADDILFVLEPADWLADPQSLLHTARHFHDYGCALMYGQFRWSDGHSSGAMPMSSPEELQASYCREQDLRPLALRKSLLQEASFPLDATPLSLLHRAGFTRTRFNDHPLVVRNADT